ncbi:low-molecular weight cobalt-containing nitrile hydratase subunit beta [Paraburkholderia sp. PGU19]|uniref:nitrile hydratase subunit beta n=1 Tax=Paraburkholderia sp. PGU19 TaxID=2735434 RepID=UPI0015D9BEF6|nr:nitrile hydratase subunit beta [Paraburkholderia sp. PGU19]BCG00051.1 low-molecular weight cobalt-containing nitrile hydratase subunit beta [Paraburkholderia sp. PGU19]
MNGAQDMGGMQSFGPIAPEPDEPYFHADWERRALALTIAMGSTGKWNIDMSRAARESLPPAQYLSSSYYEIWFAGLCKLLIDTGLATRDEIDSGVSQRAGAPVPRVLAADQVNPMLFRGSPVSRPEPYPACFAVGDAVRTLALNPSTHTRLPRYCRGKRGRIVAVRGAHVFPDSNALGRGEDPQWLYTVRFDAVELWGKDTTASSVCADCWEPYLEAAGSA